MPDLGDNPSSALSGVSCSSTSACVAVGGFEDEDGFARLLSIIWNGTEWEYLEVPPVQADELHQYVPEQPEGNDLPGPGSPAGPPSTPFMNLSAISCVTASNCVATGSRPYGTTRPPFIVRFDGDSWGEEPPAEYASGAFAVALAGISCASETQCHAVGSASYGEFPAKNFTLAYEGGVWFTPYFPAPGGGLRGVSCPQAELLSRRRRLG